MPKSDYPQTLIQEFSGIALKNPSIATLVDQIIQMRQTLYMLEDEKTSVADRISAWDRLNFLSTTKDEREEKGLKQRIRILKKELTLSQERFHSLLLGQFRKLCKTQDDFRLLLLWDQTLEIEREINFISCSCDEGSGTVRGDMSALAAVSQLQSYLQFPADESVTVGFIIEQVKRNLIEAY